MVNELRVSLAGVVAKEYTNSLYEDKNTDSYYVWANHGWWIIPWDDIREDDAAEEGRFVVAAAGGSGGGEDGSASR